MAKKAANKRSTPELDLGASTTPPKQKKAAEATETQKTCFVLDRSIPKDEFKELEKAFEESTKSNPIVPKPDPNAIMFDEYGIDGSTYDIPIILKAILCELVRRRV